MKAKDLIAELQRFDGDAHVAIEVTIGQALRPRTPGLPSEPGVTD